MMRDLATLQMSNLARLSRKPIEELQAEANAEVRAFQTGNDGFPMLFLEVLRVAEQSSNRFVEYSPVSRLARLARSIYRDGPPANTASQEEKLRRVVSAKTLNEMKHMGLYEDLYGVEPVWPHAGMLILNPYLGCNFGCVYCFRSPEQASSTEWFLKGAPIKVTSEEEIVDTLVDHPLFFAHTTQLSTHTATTDPFLPQVKESTFRLLALLEQRRLTNDVMIITKYYLTREDIERLETFRNSNILLLLTFNSNPAEIEPTGASRAFVQKRWDTLELLNEHAQHTLWGHYYRPIARGWNDSEEQITQALLYGEATGVSVLGGLKYIDGLDKYLEARDAPRPVGEYSTDTKTLDPQVLDRIFRIHEKLGLTSILVGDQSCGLTVLLSRRKLTPNVEALKMYDAAFPGRPAKCMGRCPQAQLEICARPPAPTRQDVRDALDKIGLEGVGFSVDERGLLLDTDPAHLTTSRQEALASRFRYAVFATGNNR